MTTSSSPTGVPSIAERIAGTQPSTTVTRSSGPPAPLNRSARARAPSPGTAALATRGAGEQRVAVARARTWPAAARAGPRGRESAVAEAAMAGVREHHPAVAQWRLAARAARRAADRLRRGPADSRVVNAEREDRAGVAP